MAYTLIKNCLFIPKFNFLLRTTPFWKFSNYVNSIDSSLKSCLERILNLRSTNLQWRQSTLPIRFGGLGIRRISDICLPAFLSSINGVKKLVSLLLNSKDNELNIHHYDEALAVWGVANENEIPTIPQFQKNWDNFSYPTSTRRHGNFAGVHTLLRIILSSNSAVLINIITGVSPPHFDFFVFYVLCQC
jgi:hypothetical protein